MLLSQLQEFQSSVNTDEALPKPVSIISIQGTTEDSPSCSKVVSTAIDYFCTFDLDALYIVTTPADNHLDKDIQRRMISIAKDLCNVILPYEHFGTHYDGNNDTIDEELEISNYEKGKELKLSSITFD